MADYGFKVSDTDVDALDAELAQLLLSTTYPFAKIDTSEDTSFRNITLRFNTDPPEPSGVFPDVYKDTIVYSFEHPYDYTPSFWSLIKVTSPASNTPFYQTVFQDYGVIKGTSAFSEAQVKIKADADRIYVIVTKYKDSGAGGIDSNLVGAVIRIRLFVFVEDVGE